MNESSPNWRDALAALIEETHGEPGDHPGAERWLAYHHRELQDEEEEALREHLVGCRECFDLVQAVAAFDADPEEGAEDGGVDLAAAASWQRLRGRLAKEGRPGAADPPGLGVSERVKPPRWLYTLAASLLVALVGLGGWSLHLGRELARLRKPTVNPVTLVFGEPERAEGEPAVVSASPGPWTLLVYPPLQPTESINSYRLDLIEVSGAGEQRLHVAEDLTLDEFSGLTWLLPEGLPPGTYRIDLSALGDEGWRLLASYPLRVEEHAAETGP